jgi:ABC-2 type transport system ATP-binding protein
MYSIEMQDVSHRYPGHPPIPDGISLQVPTSSIYGFLGPNGAGKTTTLKLLLGLLRRQQGSISVFGRNLDTDRIAILRDVGTLIESASLYEHLTARENLLVLQKVRRCPESRIEQVLELTGLAATGSKRAGQFSLGMKQRLGIAAALLHSPSLLILDEPTNGLDPNGIVEIRKLLLRLNQEQGITLVISSHLLAEMEKLVTHVGIIDRGRMRFQGTLDELQRMQRQVLSVSLHTGDIATALRIVAAEGLTARVEAERLVLPPLPQERIAALNRSLVQAGIEVYEIGVARKDLEGIFMGLIGD